MRRKRILKKMLTVLFNAFFLFVSITTSFAQKAAADTQNFEEQILQNPDYTMRFSKEVDSFLDTVELGSHIELSFGGVTYSSSFRGYGCMDGECSWIFSDMHPIGPSKNPGSFSKSVEVKIAKVNNRIIDPNFQANTEFSKNGTKDGSVNTGQGKEASNVGPNGGQGNNGDSSKISNANSSTSGLGDAIQQGFHAGMVSGAIQAFRDYVIIPHASVDEIRKLSKQYTDALARTHQAQLGYEAAQISLEQVASDQLIKIKNSLQTINNVDKEFGTFLTEFSGDRARFSEAKLDKLVKHVLENNNVRSVFKTKLKDTFERFQGATNITTEIEVNFKNIAQQNIGAAMNSELLGESELADNNIEIARHALDIFYGIDPYTGIHRDIYELFIGKNLITGEDLSLLERSISAVGLAGSLFTAGTSSSISNGLKAFLRASKVSVKGGNELIKFAAIIKQAEQAIARLSVLKASKTQLAKISRWTKEYVATLKEFKQSAASAFEEAFQKGLRQGKIQKLNRLSEDILKNPSHSKAIKRFNEVAVDGIKIERHNIRPGTNGKVALIGRDMGRIQKYADKLVEEGFDVEIFHKGWMEKHGKVSPVSELAEIQWAEHITKRLDSAKIRGTQIFQENWHWAEKKKFDSYTVIDTGVPTYGHFPETQSDFYDMEQTVFNFLNE